MQIQWEHFNCQTKIIDDTHVTDLTHSIKYIPFLQHLQDYSKTEAADI